MRAQRNHPDESLIQFIARRFLVLPDEQERRLKVLGVDYGTGDNLWMVAEERVKVYGLDSIAVAFDLARKYFTGKPPPE